MSVVLTTSCTRAGRSSPLPPSGTCSGSPAPRSDPVREHEAEDVGLGELGLRAEAAVERVESAHDLQRHLGGDVAGQVRVALQGGVRLVAAQG